MLGFKLLIVVTLLNVHAAESYLGGWNRATPLTLRSNPSATRSDNVGEIKISGELHNVQAEPLWQPAQQEAKEKAASQPLPQRQVLMPRPLPEPTKIRTIPSSYVTATDLDAERKWQSEVKYSLDATRPRVPPNSVKPVEPEPKPLPPKTLTIARLDESEILEPKVVFSPKDVLIVEKKEERIEKEVNSPAKPLPPRQLWSPRPLLKPTEQEAIGEAHDEKRGPQLEVMEKQEPKVVETNPEPLVIENEEREKVIDDTEPNPQPILVKEEKPIPQPIIFENPESKVFETNVPKIVEESKIVEVQQPNVVTRLQDPQVVETYETEVTNESHSEVIENQSPNHTIIKNEREEWNYRETFENNPLSLPNAVEKPSPHLTQRIIYRQRPDLTHPEPILKPLPIPRPRPVPVPRPKPAPLPIPKPAPAPLPKPAPLPTPATLPEITIPTKPRPLKPTVPTYIPKTPIEPNEELQLFDYECKVSNGYYRVQDDCDSYVECKKYSAFMYTCPDGLHFNRNAKWPEYPCAYPWEVNCQASSVKHEPQPTSECPRQFGFFAVSGDDCSKYVMCQEGKATIMNCPPGLVFNVKESACDWPVNVPSCRPKVFQGFTCPAVLADEDEDIIYKYSYGDSCRDYVACQHGKPRLLRCDLGLAFDAEAQVCVDADYVPNCTDY